MKRKIVFVFCSLFLLGNLVAQQKQQKKSFLRFDNATWNVGCISENAAKQTHIFRFINVNAEPIAIERVVTTCGCMVASYTKSRINPQQEGFVKVTFDPRGRVNHFSKTLQIICGKGESVNYLRVTGFVEPVLDPETDFPYSLADAVSVNQLVLSFQNVQQQASPKILEAKLYNDSDKRVYLSYSITNKSGCVRVQMPKSMEPKSMATIRTIATIPPNFYGSFNDRIVLLVNGKRTEALEVYGTGIDDMRGVSLLNGPKLKLSTCSFELGQLEPGKRLTRKVELANTGKSPLIVRKLECGEDVVADVHKEMVLRPGETREIVFVVTPRKASRLKADVKLISNDPGSPVRMIRFTGIVGGTQ